MAITDRGISDGSKKPLCSKKKNKNLCNQPKDKKSLLESNNSQNMSHRVNIHERGPLCESRVKPSAIHSESGEDDDYGDFLKQFSKDGWSDDDTCLWLSLGSLSPPKSCLYDNELSGLLDITSVDGSRVDPIKEASLVLGQKISDDNHMISQDNLIEDEVVSWLVRSIESEPSDSSFSCSESAESSCGQFSTPSSNSDYASSEVFDLDDFGNDKQLFWPFDWKSDMGSEGQWEFFIMSPRKSICNEEFPERKTSPEPLRLRVHKGNMHLQENECKRRLLFGSGSKSARFVELKCSTKGNKEVRRVTSMPSMLRKLSKKCVKIVPLDLEDEPPEAVVCEKRAIEYKQLWGEDFESNEEIPIEKMLGLDEFDGHEGVESEFKKDDFSLDIPL